MTAPGIHSLHPDEILPDRPFTHPRHTHFDRRLLRYLIWRLCLLYTNGPLAPHHSAGDRPTRRLEEEPDGRTLRQIVVRPDHLREGRHLTLVGFFGQRRLDVQEDPLNLSDKLLVERFHEHDGLLSYSTIELTCGNYANAVLFTSEEAKNFWGRHPDHARLAAELSPRIYHSVRIYNGQLTAGIAGPDSLRLNTVKYYDFGESPTWRGLRLLEEDRAASPPAD